MSGLAAGQDVVVRRKQYLPVQRCPVCERPFTWRRKRARDWDRLVYRSERCRRGARAAYAVAPASAGSIAISASVSCTSPMPMRNAASVASCSS
ncbi:MAG: DUF2256 domain-containing protein [Gammaproteobacteria bacterium]